jgi:hypothetical protein
VRSHNQFCRGKAISITFSECVSVCLPKLPNMQSACAVLYCHLCPVGLCLAPYCIVIYVLSGCALRRIVLSSVSCRSVPCAVCVLSDCALRRIVLSSVSCRAVPCAVLYCHLCPVGLCLAPYCIAICVLSGCAMFFFVIS